MEFKAQEMMKGEGVMHEKMPRMYSLRETAKRSGLSIYFLRQLIAEEKVRYLQCGKKYLKHQYHRFLLLLQRQCHQL